MPKGHPPYAPEFAGPALPGAEQSVSTAKGATEPGDPPARIIASPGNARGPDPRSHALDSPAPQASSSPANEPAPNAGASNQSRGHLATRRERSAHHHPQPLANAEKQRILSAAIDRAHRENFWPCGGHSIVLIRPRKSGSH